MNDPGLATRLAALHGKCFEAAWDRQAFSTLLSGPGVHAIVKHEPGAGDMAFGVVRVVVDEAEILTLGVIPTKRGGGYGRAMLDALADHARANGAKRLILEVAENNITAINLYSTAGFISIGRRNDYYKLADQRISAVILEKPLFK